MNKEPSQSQPVLCLHYKLRSGATISVPPPFFVDLSLILGDHYL